MRPTQAIRSARTVRWTRLDRSRIVTSAIEAWCRELKHQRAVHTDVYSDDIRTDGLVGFVAVGRGAATGPSIKPDRNPSLGSLFGQVSFAIRAGCPNISIDRRIAAARDVA